jgi:hypothetical protein
MSTELKLFVCRRRRCASSVSQPVLVAHARWQAASAVGQLLARRLQEILGRAGQFARVGVVRFQGGIDQQLALHAVAGIEGIGQGHQGAGEGHEHDQTAQIHAQNRFSPHGSAKNRKVLR